MEKTVSCFAFIILGVILSLINDSICSPVVVHLKKRQIIGRTIEFEGREVNEYLGIRYAQPPVGELRFKKTEKLCKVPRIFEAVNRPPACLQYSESPYPWYVNGSQKSEDCLFLNIWTPVEACTSEEKAVLFWIHGGGFRYGSIQDRLYDGVALAAVGDIIVVTVNYRVGSFGFLTTDTEEAPGNAGMWDILEALKWVNRNIGYFGGDASSITVAGESAGAIAAGYLSISPLAVGLFSQLIMESGSPALLLPEPKAANLALTELLASKVGCATDTHSLENNPQSVTECLKGVDAEHLARAESEILPRLTQDFLPQYGDELLPQNPRKAVFNGEFRCKKLLIGNNRDEASFLISTTAPEIFGFHGEKNPQINRTVGIEIVEKIIKPLLPEPQSVATFPAPGNPPLKDASGLKPNIQRSIIDNLLQNASLHEAYTLLGDLLLVCPDEYYAGKCAEIGGDVYFYFFVHRPSITPWAPWMGVAHFEEIQFVFGKPLLESQLYLNFERLLSRYMINIWSAFVRTGKPGDTWQPYSKENPIFKYLGNRIPSEESGSGPHQRTCDLIRPVFTA